MSAQETVPATADELRDIVRAKYAASARRVIRDGSAAACCGSGCGCGGATGDPVTGDLYGEDEAAAIPAAALRASLGCGNPTALAELLPGDVVLDLGSGGGIDVLLSARRVGPTGFAYGLDMTDEMLALAEQNRTEAGVTNVRFLKGQIEAIPLPDHTVDVIISNCVINLSGDKGRVLREAYRVLKPGGRFAVSDVVVQGAMPAALRRDMEAWVGCVAGALEEGAYRRLLADAGFRAVEVEVSRVYDPGELAERVGSGGGCDTTAPLVNLDGEEGRVVSAFVRARKN